MNSDLLKPVFLAADSFFVVPSSQCSCLILAVQEDDSVTSILSVIGILALFCFGIGAFVMTLTVVLVFDPFDELQDVEKD